jgi:uncharacterized peroxidase-related enzyme
MESHEKDLRSEVEDENQVHAIQKNFRGASLSSRETALLNYAVKLTLMPKQITQDDLDRLRSQGFTDEQLVDAVHCIGYFNFINRVLDGLGVDPEPGMPSVPIMNETKSWC